MIPFNQPAIVGNELLYYSQSIQSGRISGDGIFTKKCHALLEESLGIYKVLLTTSCTHSLEMAAILLQIEPGDEVIVPSFTFVSTINAFVLRGAVPVFIDIRPDTLNLDERIFERLITPKTKAIVPVHYAGIGCEMDSIMKIADAYQISVIEDNAHGLFGKYKGKNLGSFGELSTQSFHETKNFTCGEGGALFINNPKYYERSEIIREKGTNRSRFFRGQVDKYSWVDIGSSYLLSDLLAAFLFAQLQKREQIQAKRKYIWEFYFRNLQDWASTNKVQLPFVPEYCDQSFHLFYLIMPSLSLRQNIIEHLKLNGVQSVYHYLPLHLSDMGRRYGGKTGDHPVTEEMSDRLIRLPFFNDLTEENLVKVVDTVKNFNCNVLDQ